LALFAALIDWVASGVRLVVRWHHARLLRVAGREVGVALALFDDDIRRAGHHVVVKPLNDQLLGDLAVAVDVEERHVEAWHIHHLVRLTVAQLHEEARV
jgi:hypothetical protein